MASTCEDRDGPWHRGLLAGGIKANFGTMVKPLHVGQCGRNGLLAALLAEGGFDSAPDALDIIRGSSTSSTGPGRSTPTSLRQLGRAAGRRSHVDRAQAISLLRQHPSGDHDGARHPRDEDENLGAERPRPRRDHAPCPAAAPHQHTLAPGDAPSRRSSASNTRSRGLFKRSGGASEAFRRRGAWRPFPHPAHPGREHRRRVLTRTWPRTRRAQWGAEVIVTARGTAGGIARRVDEHGGARRRQPHECGRTVGRSSTIAPAASLPRDQIAPRFERLETLEAATDLGHVTRLLEVGRIGIPRSGQDGDVREGLRRQGAPETTWVP